jgi:AcrR family transcriptional regulator
MAPQQQRPTILEQWRDRERPRQSAQVSLSREQIVQATLELVRRDGARNLSIRKLAAQLGSGAASIYWHVQNKDELVALAFDEVLLAVELPEPSGDWRADCQEICRQIREVMLEFGELFDIAAGMPNVGPGSLRFTDRILGVLRTSGFPDDVVVHAHNVLLDTVIGTVMLERSFQHVYEREDMDVPELRRQYTEFFNALPEDTYPHLVAVRDQLIAGSGTEQVKLRFESGVNVLLDGLEKLRA